VGEARGYFERSQESFDLIMLMSVGGYPQLMLEPGNMIRTSEAFKVFAGHLTSDGLLVIGYSGVLDQEAVLLRQYQHTLRGLAMETHVYKSAGGEYLLLANKPGASREQKARWEAARRHLQVPGVRRLSERELRLSDFRNITDDRPYLAGNIRNVLSVAQVWEMALVLFVLIGLIGWFLATYLRRALVRQACAVRPAAVLGLAFLVGVNFMLVEQLCVIQLFRGLYNYYDSLIIGIVAFLTLTGLGSILVPQRKLAPAVAVTQIIALVWWGLSAQWGAQLGAAATFGLLAPLAVATGTFFPLLFERLSQGRLALFAMDAIGAAAGGLAGFFVPMLFGFQALTGLAVLTFVVTGAALLLFLFSVQSEPALAGTPGDR
jgi:hypothetical protein